MELKRRFGGPTKNRTRADKFELRLQVFEAYSALRDFGEVARELGKPPTTVRGLYLRACADVTGEQPKGSRKQRRLTGFHPAGHARTCGKCRSAQRVEDMCPAARALVGPAELVPPHGTARLPANVPAIEAKSEV